jgi:cation transport protein ChaC
MNDFWVFAYGSLMWSPGFFYDDVQPTRLLGYHRRLCIYSFHYRGTPKQPGLVLGLINGGVCDGLSFHIPQRRAQTSYEYLIQREQLNGVYKERSLLLSLKDGRKVQGLVFVADFMHPQYAGFLDSDKIAEIVSKAKGKTGSNKEYVLRTVRHLQGLDVRDYLLERIFHKLLRFQA